MGRVSAELQSGGGRWKGLLKGQLKGQLRGSWEGQVEGAQLASDNVELESVGVALEASVALEVALEVALQAAAGRGDRNGGKARRRGKMREGEGR